MTDNHNSSQRSYNMSRIHSRDTMPEILVRKHLFNRGFRYRKNDKRYPGKPDIVLPKYKTVIFINGCFWHKHEGCKYFIWPKTNVEYWKSKIEANVNRDKVNYSKLTDMGWNVIVLWECELKKQNINDTMDRVISNILR